MGPYGARLTRRLAGVVIEGLNWSIFIPRYDGPETLFHLDPPYRCREGSYGPGLSGRADFARMAAVPATIRGQFLLSLNDHPEVHGTFAAFRMIEVSTTYGIATKAGTKTTARAELLISNFVVRRGIRTPLLG